MASDRSRRIHKAGQTSTPAYGTAAVQSGTSSKTLDSLLYNEIITILVGPDEVKYSIHKNILISTSESFRSILSGGGKERENFVLKLPNDEPRAFQVFIGWAYAQPLVALNNTPVEILGAPSNDNKKAIRDYYGLYVLAERHKVNLLQNEAMDIIYTFVTTDAEYLASSAEMEFVHENTLPDSKLRQLLISSWSMVMYDRVKRRHLLIGERAELMERNGALAMEILKRVAGVELSFDREVPGITYEPRGYFYVHESTSKFASGTASKPSALAATSRGGGSGAQAGNSSSDGSKSGGRCAKERVEEEFLESFGGFQVEGFPSQKGTRAYNVEAKSTQVRQQVGDGGTQGASLRK